MVVDGCSGVLPVHPERTKQCDLGIIFRNWVHFQFVPGSSPTPDIQRNYRLLEFTSQKEMTAIFHILFWWAVTGTFLSTSLALIGPSETKWFEDRPLLSIILCGPVTWGLALLFFLIFIPWLLFNHWKDLQELVKFHKASEKDVAVSEKNN